MHTITRNMSEIFTIAGAVDIEVQILDTQAGKLKLGLTMPKNTYIANHKVRSRRSTGNEKYSN